MRLRAVRSPVGPLLPALLAASLLAAMASSSPQPRGRSHVGGDARAARPGPVGTLCPDATASLAVQANPRSGPAGSNLGLSGFVPSYDEAGEYDPNGVRVSFWWGLGQDDWIKVVSSSRDGFVIRLVDADVADPSVIRLAEADVADRCTYAVQAIVPDVTPGQYPITGVYFSDDGGAAALRTEIFTVTGG